MVSSVGGKLAAPFIGGYVASKHGLEGMSGSLRRELMLYGIDVIIVGRPDIACLPSAIAPPLFKQHPTWRDYTFWSSSVGIYNCSEAHVSVAELGNAVPIRLLCSALFLIFTPFPYRAQLDAAEDVLKPA